MCILSQYVVYMCNVFMYIRLVVDTCTCTLVSDMDTLYVYMYLIVSVILVS